MLYFFLLRNNSAFETSFKDLGRVLSISDAILLLGALYWKCWCILSFASWKFLMCIIENVSYYDDKSSSLTSASWVWPSVRTSYPIEHFTSLKSISFGFFLCSTPRTRFSFNSKQLSICKADKTIKRRLLQLGRRIYLAIIEETVRKNRRPIRLFVESVKKKP